MKSLEQFGLAQGQKITYQSPVCALLEAMEHPNPTPLALQINSLVQAYLNQWGFLLTAYEKLYSIYQLLSRTDDQANKPPGLTDFDTITLHIDDDIRLNTYVLIISMKSIFDFFACLLEAAITTSVPDDAKLTDLSKFKKKRLTAAFHSLSFLDDSARFTIVNEVEQLRHCIIHRGYAIRTKFGFKRDPDLPIVIYQGNNIYADHNQIYVGSLFARFIDCMQLWESNGAAVLPTLQPKMALQPNLSISFTLDGGTTLVEIKELTPSNH